jgi:phosphatidylserine/phosphatidylglycerophosphate/cardiolipin synthase-like enzyme
MLEYEPLPIISKDFPKVVIPLIDSAKFSLDIVVFDWRFYKNDPSNPVSEFNISIARAVRRGVNVRCLVQSDSVVDNLKNIGCWAKKLQSKRILHTKLLIIDKKRIIIGSHNYTQHAFTSNHEASIYVELKEENNQLVEYFNNLFGL